MVWIKRTWVLGAVLLCTSLLLAGAQPNDRGISARDAVNDAAITAASLQQAKEAVIVDRTKDLEAMKAAELAKIAANRSTAATLLGGPRQGGDTCATAMVVTSLPFSDTGTTAGYVNDYDSGVILDCPYSGSTSPDVAYSYTPAADITVDITLCANTAYDSKLYVFQGSCPGTVVACNDDFCTTPSYPYGYVSAVSGVSLTGGTTYYIIVDGYGAADASGSYTIDITEGEEPPPPPECPVDSLFAQRVHLPTDAWTFGVSDTRNPADPTYGALIRYESFSGVTSPICDIHWWGLSLSYPWANCTETPSVFEIKFYQDAGGTPGAQVGPTYTVTPIATATGLLYSGFEGMYYQVMSLEPCVALPAGWVSIQGVSVGTPTDCWFLWGSSPIGNASSLLYDEGLGTWTTELFDLSLCLTGEYIPTFGACCNDANGACEDDVEMINCLGTGMRFVANTLCENLVPACGQITGACCYPDGTCEIKTQAACELAWWCDLDGDGDVEDEPPYDDYWLFVDALGTCVGDEKYNPQADHNADGCVTLHDYQDWVMCFRDANGGKTWVPPKQKKSASNSPKPRGGISNGSPLPVEGIPLPEPAPARIAGIWLGANTTCDACPPVGACCVDLVCVATTWAEDCTGMWWEGETCPEFTCPTCTPEPEPCGTDTNGGCNSTPYVWGAISCGEMICGTSFFDGATRDTDWFVVQNLTGSNIFTIQAQAEFDLQLLFMTDAGQDCVGYSYLVATGLAGQLVTITTDCLPVDTYYVWVGPQFTTTFPCPGAYWVTLGCQTCSIPLGACCNPNTGVCTPNQSSAQCTAAGGNWLGEGITCGPPNPCPQPPTGACCINEVCTATTIQYDCTGSWFQGETCPEFTCPACGDFEVTGPGVFGPYTTCGAGDDCNLRVAEDHTFQVTLPTDGVWIFSLCDGGASWDSYLYLTSDCCAGTIIAYDDDSCGAPTEMKSTFQATVTAGVYYVTVEGYNNTYCGEYSLDIHQPPTGACCIDQVCTATTFQAECGGMWYEGQTCPEFSCPSCFDCTGSTPESEPCGSDTNGGCNMATPTFEPIACNSKVLGTAWFDGSTRDTDWYELVLAQASTITVAVTAEFEVVAGPLGQYVLGVPGCANITGYISPYFVAPMCQQGSVTTNCYPAGTYYIFVGTTFAGLVTCPAAYCLEVTCIPCQMDPYCLASGGCDEFISNLTMDGINNTTGCDGWGDYTALPSSVPAGSSNPITVTVGPPWYTTDLVNVWIDWDNDLDLLDETAVLLTNNMDGTYSGSIDVPANAGGDYRMRARTEWNFTVGPCGNSTYGDVEDYTLTVVPPGNDCALPIVIELPADIDGVWNDTTCGRVNDYADTCMGYYDGGEDIIYQLVVTADTCVNVVMTTTDTWTGMTIDDSCPLDPTTCLRSGTNTGAGGVTLNGVSLLASVGTYYIMIDTWPSPNCIAAFTLTITQCQLGACCIGGVCVATTYQPDCTGTWFVGETCPAFTGCPQPPPETCALARVITLAQMQGAGYHDSGILGTTDDCVGRPYFDIWYKYVCTCTGAYTFDMCYSDLDTYMKVWSGPVCCVTSVGTADDECTGTIDPLKTFNLTSGTTYWIECGHYYTAGPAGTLYNFNAVTACTGE